MLLLTVFISILCVTHYNNLSSCYTSISQDKLNFLKVFLLHNFTKYFSDARVYEIVNNCLSVVQNICSTEKLMMLEVVLLLKLWHCQITWYLFAGFKTIILFFFTVSDLSNTCFLQKYGLWKLQLNSWNTNDELINQTLTPNQAIF